MGIEDEIRSMSRNAASGFAVDIRNIIQRLVADHRDRLLEEFTRETKRNVDDVMANRISTDTASQRTDQSVQEKVQGYHKRLQDEMIAEVMRLHDAYRDDYFATRAKDQFGALVKDLNLMQTLGEDGFRKLMELHVKSFAEEMQSRVSTILNDGQRDITAACENFVERTNNILKQALG